MHTMLSNCHVDCHDAALGRPFLIVHMHLINSDSERKTSQIYNSFSYSKRLWWQLFVEGKAADPQNVRISQVRSNATQNWNGWACGGTVWIIGCQCMDGLQCNNTLQELGLNLSSYDNISVNAFVISWTTFLPSLCTLDWKGTWRLQQKK